MGDTIFGKIARGEIPCDKLYEDELVLAFRDLHPQAPFHALVIPKKPIASMAEVEPGDEALLGRLLGVASRVAREQGFAEDGYRLVINCKGEGGQTVYHLHVHLLAGRQMGWPPG